MVARESATWMGLVAAIAIAIATAPAHAAHHNPQ
jgi:hypothetical protein